jgi:hypothetical protein
MSAAWPEELETLLEDAVLLGDEAAVLSLFDAGAVLITGARVTGPEKALTEFAALGYVAASRTVTERRDLAVSVGDHAVNVSCRAPDGVWRLVAAIVELRCETGGLQGPETRSRRRSRVSARWMPASARESSTGPS